LLRFWKKPRLHGWIDVVDRFHVVGWAAYRGGVAPTLTVEVDGKPVGRVTPKYERRDLTKRFGENINLGFCYGFPEPLAGGETVSIRDKRGSALDNSPKTIPLAKTEQDLSDVIGDLSTPLPKEELIFLVNGHWDKRQFAQTRAAAVPAIIGFLDEAGIDYRGFDTILDFGCGCGRILAGWEHRLPPAATLLGCDINPKLVEFCSANIPFARTWVSSYLPPLRQIADASVDFVYAASVFTHTTRAAANKWAVEMKRVIKPNGILMVSFSGSYFAKWLAEVAPKGWEELNKTGFYCHVHGTAKRTTLGSNDYAVFMTPQFVERLFAGFHRLWEFQGLLRGSHAFASTQDVAIFQRHSFADDSN